MASENYEISDIVKKCKILLLDIEGTTTSISFVKDKLFPYAEANVKQFLESQWDNEEVKEAVAGLRKLAVEDQDKKVEGVVTISEEDGGKDEQIEGLVSSVKWLMSADRKVGPLKQLQGLIWNQGYGSGDIKGHVYDDVSAALELWRSTEGQKVYIYSSGSVQAQKLLFNNSVAGDLLPHIEGHFDTAIGAKQEAASYAAIAEKIGSKPEEILFLTDIVKEAEAARSSGVQAALVIREGNAPLPEEATSSFPVLHSFDQLAVSNKRKPDPQVEEVPAKVPKTDIEADVKSASEMEATETTPESIPAAKTVASTEAVAISENGAPDTPVEEPEKMEVEEELPVVETATVTGQVEKKAEKPEEAHVRVETSIEEVTNNETGDAIVCDVKPEVIEESVEKTEKNETEMMETESTDNVETAIEPKESPQEKIEEQSPLVGEESPPSVITVQDVTNDQENITEGTEIIDDIVPVVEEPPTVEMEDLKNVGDVLEKECDEILSKVQDVTNLDNIPAKPLLNTISEESIESENGENTNDIVDSILDSEMELGAKSCDDIDVNTVQEIIDTKDDIVDEKSGEGPFNVEESSALEVKQTENAIENKEEEKEQEHELKENLVESKEEKVEEVSTAETVAQETKKEEVKEESSDTTDVTKGIIEGNKLAPVEEKMETADNVPEPVLIPDIVPENKETKELNAEVVEINTESKDNTVDQDDKMESEESAAIPEKESETKKKIAEQVENKTEIIDNTVEPVENKVEITETIAEPVENKPETKESIADLVENKAATTEIIAEPVDSEMETTDSIPQTVEGQKTSENTIENKDESKGITPEQVDNKMKSVETAMETEESADKPVENKIESKESTPQENRTEDITEPEPVAPESKVNENSVDKKETTEVNETVAESTDAPNGVPMVTEATEKQVNGKTNGEANQNGDASKDEELTARLSVENGENSKEMNGANGNGDSGEEKGQGDNKVETEIPDIKVKTVATEEPRTDPIEQPVEA